MGDARIYQMDGVEVKTMIACARCATETATRDAGNEGWMQVIIPQAGVERVLCDCCVSDVLQAMKPPHEQDRPPLEGRSPIE